MLFQYLECFSYVADRFDVGTRTMIDTMILLPPKCPLPKPHTPLPYIMCIRTGIYQTPLKTCWVGIELLLDLLGRRTGRELERDDSRHC